MEGCAMAIIGVRALCNAICSRFLQNTPASTTTLFLKRLAELTGQLGGWSHQCRIAALSRAFAGVWLSWPLSHLSACQMVGRAAAPSPSWSWRCGQRPQDVNLTRNTRQRNNDDVERTSAVLHFGSSGIIARTPLPACQHRMELSTFCKRIWLALMDRTN